MALFHSQTRRHMIKLLTYFYFRLDDLIKITDEAFSEIGEDRWRRACAPVEKTIQEMKDSDHFTGQQMEPFIIHVTVSSDSSTDTASEGETDNSSTDTASETEMPS